MGLLDFIKKKNNNQDNKNDESFSAPSPVTTRGVIPTTSQNNTNLGTTPLAPLSMNNTNSLQGMATTMPQAQEIDNTFTPVVEDFNTVRPVDSTAVVDAAPTPTAWQPATSPTPNVIDPIPDLNQSHDPNSMQSEFSKADPGNGFHPAPLQQTVPEAVISNDPLPVVENTQTTEETIFGDAPLADLYNEKFPNPNNIKPDLMGSTNNDNVSVEPVAPTTYDIPTNVDLGMIQNDLTTAPAEPVTSMSDMQNMPPITETQNPVAEQQGSVSLSELTTGVSNPAQSENKPFDINNFDFKIPDFTNMLGNNPAVQTPSAPAPTSEPVVGTEAQTLTTNDTTAITPEIQTQTNNNSVPESEVTIPVAPVIGIESTLNKETTTPIQNILDEQQKQTLTPEEKVEKPKSKGAPIKKIFRKVALIGLNGPSTNLTMANDVTTLVSDLLKGKIEVTIDSESGLGQHAVHAAKTTNTKLTSVLLKPVLSTVELNQGGGTTQESGFVVIYSNFVEWLKHMMKEPRLFVVFDGGGLLNQTLLMNILSISGLYSGHHKPIILVGGSWKAKLDSLKASGIIDDEDISNLTLVNDTKAIMSHIDELNMQYAKSDTVKVAKVVDRRIEGDEKEYMIY